MDGDLRYLERRQDDLEERVDKAEEQLVQLPVLIERMSGMIRAWEGWRTAMFTVAGMLFLLVVALVANLLVKGTP